MPTPSGAAENGQQREIEADRPQRDQHTDDEQDRAHELAEHDAEVRVELGRLDQTLFDETGNPQRDDQREHDDQHRRADRQKRDTRFPQRNLDVVERVGDLGKQAEEIEQDQRKNRERDSALRRGQPALRLEHPAQSVNEHANRREGDQERRGNREKERRTDVATKTRP
jgi:hypothetical protein